MRAPPGKRRRMSTITEPLRTKYLRCSLPLKLESKNIPRNFTELTLGIGIPKIFNAGSEGRFLLLEKTIHWDFSGEISNPLYFKKSEIRSLSVNSVLVTRARRVDI